MQLTQPPPLLSSVVRPQEGVGMLTGERTAATVFGRFCEAGIYLMFLSPFILMGGGMVLVGMLALGPRKDIPELWICLPVGLVILGLFGRLLYWSVWRVPALTVTRFAFDGSELELKTLARGVIVRPVGVLRAITEERGVRGRGLLGWWLRLEGVGRVYLDRFTPNAETLIGQLRPLVGHKRAEPGAAADGGA